MRVQLLVTTMKEKDFSLVEKMNIKTDAVIANQTDFDEIKEIKNDGSTIKLISTKTIGVSKNRNIAIGNSDSDIVIFSDDDLHLYNDYEKIIVDAFNNEPNADAIKFNLNCISKRKITMATIREFHRCKRKEVTSWGVCALAIKRDVLINKHLSFNERFGPGTQNFCGEDGIFLQELFKKKVKLYASPVFIADIDQTESSWYEGYTERFITTLGMILNEMYPLLSPLLIIRSAFKFSRRKECNFGFFKLLKFYHNGIKKNRKEKRQLKIK